MRNLIALCAVAAFVPAIVQGQLNITSTDFFGMVGSTQILENDRRFSIPVNVGSPGPNQTWDFRTMGIPSPEISISQFLNPAGTPFDTTFPQANLVQYITDTSNSFHIYNYYDISPSSFFQLGNGSIIPPPTDTSFFNTDNEMVAPLPLSYNASWTSTRNDTMGSYPSFAIVSIDTTRNRIDGWGTVRLPAGDFQTLRLREDFKNINLTIIGGVVFSSSTETGIMYSWLAKNVFTVASIQSQDGETDSNFTDARGYNRLSSLSTGVVERSEGLPLTIDLKQNYPNPFNPSTKIEFGVSQAGTVSLSVFDVLGRSVATLAEGKMQAGNYSVEFSPALSSGMYFYRLQTPTGTITKRMVLQK